MNTYEYTNTVGEIRKFVGNSISIAGTIVTIEKFQTSGVLPLSSTVVAFINLAPGDFIRWATFTTT